MFNKDDAAAAVMSFTFNLPQEPISEIQRRILQHWEPEIYRNRRRQFLDSSSGFLAGSSMGDLLSRAARPTCVLMRITQR